MAISNVVVPSNLGSTIKAAAIAANKYDINLDQDTLIADGSGVVKLNPSSATIQTLVQNLETTTTLTYDAATKVLTYTNEDGVVSTVDLSTLAVDVNLSSGSYDAATFVLTLSDSDGSQVTVSLADLKKVTTAASSTVSFTGTGEDSSPLQADVKISTAAGNQLSVDATGLLVPAAYIQSVTDTPTVVLGVGGADALSADVQISSVSNNTLRAEADGLYVPKYFFNSSDSITFNVGSDGTEVVADIVPGAVTYLATVEIQDAFGVHIGYMFP